MFKHGSAGAKDAVGAQQDAGGLRPRRSVSQRPEARGEGSAMGVLDRAGRHAAVLAEAGDRRARVAPYPHRRAGARPRPGGALARPDPASRLARHPLADLEGLHQGPDHHRRRGRDLLQPVVDLSGACGLRRPLWPVRRLPRRHPRRRGSGDRRAARCGGVHRRPDDPHRRGAQLGPQLHLRGEPAALAVERQLGDEGLPERPERGLRRA